MAKRVNDTLAERGEFGLIAAITERLPQGPAIVLGPGDDAAVISAPDGRVVATTDVLVEGVHFRRDWSTAYDVGRKAAAQNLADVAAMGARPQALLAGFAAPGDLAAEWALEFADGLGEECRLAGASVAGGDVVSAPRIVISITALGSLQGRPPLTRSGARPGDVVAVCGRLGWSAAGLEVLSRGGEGEGEGAESADRKGAGAESADRKGAGAGDVVPGGVTRDRTGGTAPERLPGPPAAWSPVVEAHRRPEPPYDAGPEAAALGATSLIDVSDGLLADLTHIARASRVRIDLSRGGLEAAEPVRAVAAALGVDPLTYVLAGGEDHALAGTFPAGTLLPERWRVVGRVRPAGVLPEPPPAPGAEGEAQAGRRTGTPAEAPAEKRAGAARRGPADRGPAAPSRGGTAGGETLVSLDGEPPPFRRGHEHYS